MNNSWAIITVILGLGLWTFNEWKKSHRFSQRKVQKSLDAANRLANKEDWEAADKELNSLLLSSHMQKELALLYVRVKSALGEYDKALVFLNKVISECSEDYKLLYCKGHLLLQMGEAKEALSLLEQVEPQLKSEQEMLDLALALFRNGYIRQCLHKITKFIPTTCNGRLLSLVGDCHFQKRNFSESIEMYQKALKYDWNNKNVLLKLGHCLGREGKKEESERCFRDVLEHDIADIKAALGLGISYMERGDFNRALLTYQHPAIWDQEDPKILKQAAICMIKLGKYAYGEMYLSESIRRGEVSAQALALLGFSQECQKKWQDAEQSYFMLIKQFPDHVSGYRGLSWLYGVGLSFSLCMEQGVTMAHKALQICPDAASWEILSACEARAGNFLAAHNIQERLCSQTKDQMTRERRQEAMRMLRRREPLKECHVAKSQVA